jgi:hypothetical protein
MNDEIAQRLWSWSMHTGDPLFAEAAEEIARLNDLVAELIPYMLLDVRSGLDLGTPPKDCCDNCSDCDWYAEAMDWKRRIESGELGDVTLGDR